MIKVPVKKKRGLANRRTRTITIVVAATVILLAVTITGKSLREVAEFVHARLAIIEGVTGTATHFILKKYKEKNHIFAKLHEQVERMLFE